MRAFFGILFLATLGMVRADVRILGSHPGVVDRMGAGIAELAAGNTGTAKLHANPASYWNPALLAFERRPVFGVGSDNRSLARHGGYLSVQGRVAPIMGMGLALLNRGDFDVDVYDENEEYLGTARPQDFATYLGIGVKTSRANSYGISVQWFQSSRDIGGLADINTIGVVNLGWFRRWSKKFYTGVVLRNLGLNSDLTAKYEYRSGIGSSEVELDATSHDFFPKTLVAAAMYRYSFLERNADIFFEFLDYQLDRVFFDFDRDHHVQALRFGVDWELKSNAEVRTGFDRGNITMGFGHRFFFMKNHHMTLDYAVVLERYALTINVLIFGLQYHL